MVVVGGGAYSFHFLPDFGVAISDSVTAWPLVQGPFLVEEVDMINILSVCSPQPDL